MKKKVLILSTTEGHASLARATRSILGDSYLVEEVELIKDFGSYRFVYRFMPSTFKWIWNLGNKKITRELVELYTDKRYAKKIKEVVEDYQPDLVITTYFLYQFELAKLKQVSGFKWINVVQNPISIVPIELARMADVNLGFGKEFKKLGREMGIAETRLVEVGWLVDKEFYKEISQERKFKRLSVWGFEKDKLTVVVCGGSEGTNMMLKILPDLLTPKGSEKFQIVFITGTNRWLKKTIEKVIELLKKTKVKLPKTVVLGFTKEMAEILKVADVVVGKAGPNLLFEAVAARKPFIAIAHIEGQESGNLELIEREGFGWVAEERERFRDLWRKIEKNPKILRKWDRNLMVVAEKNKRGLEKTKELIEELLNE